MTQSAPAVASVAGASPRLAGLGRRMSCFVYEGVLLFGVLMAAGLLYGIVTGQRDAMVGRHGLQLFVFVVLGVYFSWFWTHGGQTLAMKTWRIRLVRAGGEQVSLARAWLRYLLAWLWFAPALVWLWLEGASSLAPTVATIASGVIVYAALARLLPGRQFWHDIVCDTRLVEVVSARAATAHG